MGFNSWLKELIQFVRNGKPGTSLHYTTISHSIWIQHCLREQYVYIVTYEPGVMLWLMNGSFFVSVYPRSDGREQDKHKINKLHTYDV
jgi:hypothetical protein